MKCTRRQILIGFFGLAAGGGIAGKILLGGKSAPAHRGIVLPFTPAQQKTLLGAVERALPGAVEAGVPEYISYWLTKDRFLSGLKKQFEIGLFQLDRVSRELHSKLFWACSGEQQDAVFKRFQSGGVKLQGFDGAKFFEHLVTLTLEGFFSDPKYGGNRNQVGWKFIGFKPCWWSPRSLEPSDGNDAGAQGEHQH